MRAIGFLALFAAAISGGEVRAEDCPTTACVKSCTMAPVTLFSKPQPPDPVCGHDLKLCPIMIYRAETEQPICKELAAPGSVVLFRTCPKPVPIFAGSPPPVRLFRLEPTCPDHRACPPAQPVVLFRVCTAEPCESKPIRLPPITLYQRPQPACPACACAE